jgi:hypothetical protein
MPIGSLDAASCVSWIDALTLAKNLIHESPLNFYFSGVAAALFAAGAGSAINFLIIACRAELSWLPDPTLMKRTTPRLSIKKVVGILPTA